jgi:2-hydroxy-3-keto-5-methylthiopentenyl-1-phosphate phosphatase
LEIHHQGNWQPVVRYDNAHGFCHCDVIHPDGAQDKTPLFIGDANDTFTSAIKEMRTHWVTHRDRYLKEIKS